MDTKKISVAEAINGSEKMLRKWHSWETANSGVMKRTKVLLQYIKDLEDLTDTLLKALMRTDNDIISLTNENEKLQSALDHSNKLLISYMKKVGDLI